MTVKETVKFKLSKNIAEFLASLKNDVIILREKSRARQYADVWSGLEIMLTTSRTSEETRIFAFLCKLKVVCNEN